MQADPFIPIPARAPGARWQALLPVGGWLLLVLGLVSIHVVWRDEVRALSLALHGQGVVDMLRGLHGEGHPALWYLLLRGAHALLPATVVLPVVSILVALAAMVLLARRSPFGWVVIAVFALGRPALYEYSVMARNYGISMLLMFAFAALYQRHRDRGIVLGVVLFLLANCNAHSAILAGAFCLFWLLDLLGSRREARPGALRTFWINAALAVLGVAVCAATIYPPFNDAAQGEAGAWRMSELVRAIVLPSISFSEISGYPMWRSLLAPWSLWRPPFHLAVHLSMSLLLIGSVVGLARRPAALVAGGAALLGLSVFFSMIYAGGYRHQALWLVFMLSLYWIAGRPVAGKTTAPGLSPARRRASEVGFALFFVLLLLQVALSVTHLAPIVSGRAPESRSRDLVRLVSSQPELKDAIIVADPDYLVESVAHYLPNRTYLLRESRYGDVVVFTRKARLALGLDEVLADARRLRAESGRPVLILLSARLDPKAPARTISQGYNWTFTTTPSQVAEFLSATRPMASFGPACCSDESFDVHLLER